MLGKLSKRNGFSLKGYLLIKNEKEKKFKSKKEKKEKWKSEI